MSEVAKDGRRRRPISRPSSTSSIVSRMPSRALQKERKTLELARAKLNVLEKYTREKTTKALKVEAERKRTEELAKKEAWMLEKNKTGKLKKQIEACRIFAPRDGVVVYANDPGRRGSDGRPQVEEGAMVRERQKIASVLDLAGPMQVNLKVPESKVDFVAPGLRATVTVDAFPLSTLPGTVASVAPLPDPFAMASWDSKVYTTKVRLDEGLPALRPGMTARVEIKVSELHNVLAVPIQSVIRLDGKDQVAIQRPDGGFEWRTVVLGEQRRDDRGQVGTQERRHRGTQARDAAQRCPEAANRRLADRAGQTARREPQARPAAERSLNDDCCNCNLVPKLPESQAPLLVPFERLAKGSTWGRSRG